MASTAHTIADALVTALNVQFAGTFIAAKRVDPSFTPEDLKTLTVSVIPRTLDLSWVARGVRQKDVEIDIGIQKKLTSSNVNSECSTLSSTVESVVDFLPGATISGAVFIDARVDPLSVQEHLDVRVFSSVITVTYRQT